MTEYIYLVQPREFIKTKENIYKIGKTKQENLKRICGYSNGTKLICQFESKDCDIAERELIKLFKEKYELQKDIGNEYFKGNCNDMRDDIFNYIRDENIIEFEEDNNKDCDEDDEEEDNYGLDEIKEIFPCYKDDECFGGKKKLVKIKFENNKIYAYYIDDKELDEIFLQRDWYQKDELDKTDYISNILDKKIIQNDMIYDLNDSDFIRILIKYKTKITLTYTDIDIPNIISETNKLNNNILFKIKNILFSNCILNNDIYCDYINNSCDIDCIRNVKITIININKKHYCYAFLRKYTPYMIDVNENGYYIYNRDYQIIDMNDGKYSIENWKGNRIYLYDDCTNPIRSYHTEKEFKKLFKDMMIKYNNITSNKKCMNMNEKTQMILNLI
jgi:hypothetical protein